MVALLCAALSLALSVICNAGQAHAITVAREADYQRITSSADVYVDNSMINESNATVTINDSRCMRYWDGDLLRIKYEGYPRWGSTTISNPYTVTYANAGTCPDGRKADIVVECKSAYMNGSTPRIIEGFNDQYFWRDGGVLLYTVNYACMESYSDYDRYPEVEQTYDIYAVYHDTSTKVPYSLGYWFFDIDQPDAATYSYGYSRSYVESIRLVSGVDGPAYVSPNTMLNLSASSSGWFRATGDDEMSYRSGVVCVSQKGVPLRISFRGMGCGTFIGFGMPGSLSAAGTATITATKTFSGGTMGANRFTFDLVEKGTNRVVATAKNAANGTFSFAVPYNQGSLGTHEYLIRERNTGETGMVYDTHTEAVTVRALLKSGESGSNRTIAPTVTYASASPKFANAWAKYNIAYNLAGGSFGAYHPTEATFNTAFTVSNPSRTGYMFQGWTITGMDSCTHTYGNRTTTATSLASVKDRGFKNLRASSGTVTFTAVWTPITYKVVFMGNGATGGSVASIDCKYDQEYAMPSNGFSRTDWTYTRWNRSADDTGTAYAPGNRFKNLSATNGATVYIYAQWNPHVKYVVDAKADYFTSVAGFQLNYDVAARGQAFTVSGGRTSGATRANCTHLDGSVGFDGWYTDAACTARWTDGTRVSAPITLYARNWATVTYADAGAYDPSVTYSAGGSSGALAAVAGTPAAFEKPYGTVVTLSETANRRVTYDGGATFPSTLRAEEGWHLDEACTGAPFTTYTTSTNATLYKNWVASIADGVDSGRR